MGNHGGNEHHGHHHGNSSGDDLIEASFQLIVIELFKIAFDLIVLIFSAWSVAEGCEILSTKFDASILGGILIAWLNTLPEAMFFLKGLQSNNVTFAIGALAGSANVHPTIAVGLCILIGGLKQKNGRIQLYKSVRMQTKLLGCSAIIVAMILLFGFNIIVGAIGVGYYIIFFVVTLWQKKEVVETRKDVVDHDGDIIVEENEVDGDDKKPNLWKGVGYLVVGGGLLFFFSDPFIDSIVMLAKMINFSPLALAFLIAPIASEAPEVLEAILLSRKGKTKMINIGFSNLVGGTVTKTTLLCGMLCFYGDIRNFEWIFPSFTVSLFLVMVTVMVNGLYGFSSSHKAVNGVYLLVLFFINTFVTLFSEGFLKEHVHSDSFFSLFDGHSHWT